MSWYVSSGGKVDGPYDDEAVEAAIKKGLKATAQIRPEDGQDWRPLDSHPPFAAILRWRERGKVPVSREASVVVSNALPAASEIEIADMPADVTEACTYEPPGAFAQALVWIFRAIAAVGFAAAVATLVIVAATGKQIVEALVQFLFQLVYVVTLLGMAEVVVMLIRVRAMSFATQRKLDAIVAHHKFDSLMVHRKLDLLTRAQQQ